MDGRWYVLGLCFHVTCCCYSFGWHQKGHPCSYLLDDFSTQALVITQPDRVWLEELSQKKVIWGVCVKEYFSLRLIDLSCTSPSPLSCAAAMVSCTLQYISQCFNLSRSRLTPFLFCSSAFISILHCGFSQGTVVWWCRCLPTAIWVTLQAGPQLAPSMDAFLLQKSMRGNVGKAQSVSTRAPEAKDCAMCLIPLTENDASDPLFIGILC